MADPKMTAGYPEKGDCKIFVHVRSSGGDSKIFAISNEKVGIELIKCMKDAPPRKA